MSQLGLYLVLTKSVVVFFTTKAAKALQKCILGQGIEPNIT